MTDKNSSLRWIFTVIAVSIQNESYFGQSINKVKKRNDYLTLGYFIINKIMII